MKRGRVKLKMSKMMVDASKFQRKSADGAEWVQQSRREKRKKRRRGV